MRQLAHGTVATFVLAGLVAAGCTPEQEREDAAARGTAPDQVVGEAEFREHAEEAYDTYAEAAKAGDWETAAVIWSEDVRVRGTQGLEDVQGREDLLERLQEFAAQYRLESMDFDIQDVIVAGDHVWESGTYDETFRVGEEEEVSMQGAYAALWRLEADGRWRIHRYIWNVHPQEGES